MEIGSNSKPLNKRSWNPLNNSNDRSNFVPNTDHNPKNLNSWAKKTDFVLDYSGEAWSSESEKFELFQHRGRWSSSSPDIEKVSAVGRMSHDNDIEIQPAKARCCPWFKCLGV